MPIYSSPQSPPPATSVSPGAESAAEYELHYNGAKATGTCTVLDWVNWVDGLTVAVPGCGPFTVKKTSTGQIDVSGAATLAAALTIVGAYLAAASGSLVDYSGAVGNVMSFTAKAYGADINALPISGTLLAPVVNVKAVAMTGGLGAQLSKLSALKPAPGPLTWPNVIVTDGDSITAEGQWQALLSLTSTSTIYNQAHSGIELWLMQSQAAAVDALFSCVSLRNICVIFGGSNNSLYVTPGDAYKQLVAYCRARKTVGWQVVVVTMPSRTGTAQGSITMDVWSTQYNALIRQGFATSRLPCDAVADIALNPAIGAPGASTSLTYFPADGTHLNRIPASATIIAASVSAAINGLTASDVLVETNLALGKTYVLTPDPTSSGFPDAGGVQLTNGLVREDLYASIEMTVAWAAASGASVIDLGASHAVSRVRCYFGGGYPTAHIAAPGSVTVATSVNGTDFTNVAAWTSATDIGEGWWSIDFQAAVCRYVRITMTLLAGASFISIGEHEVYGF